MDLALDDDDYHFHCNSNNSINHGHRLHGSGGYGGGGYVGSAMVSNALDDATAGGGTDTSGSIRVSSGADVDADAAREYRDDPAAWARQRRRAIEATVALSTGATVSTVSPSHDDDGALLMFSPEKSLLYDPMNTSLDNSSSSSTTPLRGSAMPVFPADGYRDGYPDGDAEYGRGDSHYHGDGEKQLSAVDEDAEYGERFDGNDAERAEELAEGEGSSEECDERDGDVSADDLVADEGSADEGSADEGSTATMRGGAAQRRHSLGLNGAPTVSFSSSSSSSSLTSAASASGVSLRRRASSMSLASGPVGRAVMEEGTEGSFELHLTDSRAGLSNAEVFERVLIRDGVAVRFFGGGGGEQTRKCLVLRTLQPVCLPPRDNALN